MALRLPSHPLVRLAVLAAVVVVGLVLITWAALAIFLPPAKLKSMVEQRLADALSREVRFASAAAGLWPPVRVTVKDVAIAEPGGFAQGALFQARAIHLDLHVFALFGGRVVVRRLALEEPQVHALLRADGTTNFDGLGKPARAPATGTRPARADGLTLAVEQFEIQDGRVLIDDVRAGRRVAFGLATRTSFALAGGARVDTRGETTIQGLAFGPLTASGLADLNQALAPLEWQIEHRGAYDAAREKLALETLGLRFGRTQLAVSGVIDRPGSERRVDLRARGTGVALAEVLAFLAHAQGGPLAGLDGDGTLDFDLAVRGTLAAAFAGTDSAKASSTVPSLPSITGTVAITKCWLQLAGAPAKIEDLQLTANLAPDSLGIGDLSARIAGQPIRGSIAVERFADPRVQFAIQGDVDLAAVAPLVVPKETQLSGRAALDVRGRGRAKEPGAMALEGRARLSDVRVVQPALPQPVEKISGELVFSQTRAKVSGLTAHAGRSSFTLDADVERPLSLTAKPDDLKPPPPATLAFTFQSPHLDMADFSKGGGGGPVPLNARGSGRVSIGKLKSGRVEMDRVRANVTLEPWVLAAQHFDARIYEGELSGSARFDVTDPKHPQVVLDSKLDSARVERLLGTWVPPGQWLQGSLSTSLDVRGDLSDVQRSLTAAGLAAVWNGSLVNLPVLDELASFTKLPSLSSLEFQDLRTSFRLERGRVLTGPAKLSGPSGEWTASGSVGLDGSLDYVTSITLPPDVVKRLGGTAAIVAGAVADDQGRILLDLRIGGTTKQPKIALDQQATADRLRGRVSGALAEQQKKLERQARDTLAALARTGGDSARAMARLRQKQLEDSLLKQAGKLLDGFFGGSKRDTGK